MKARINRQILTSLFLLLVSPHLSWSQEGPSTTFMSNLETAANLADGRGFLKGKSNSVDGNLIVSKLNGNVQYRYDISSMSINGVKLGLSLSYNQNASYTAFKRWHRDSNAWQQFKQNRPVWIFGVGGFAVQPISMCSRPFIDDELRNDNPTYVTLPNVHSYDDNDVIWALDGWDFCNRMKGLDRDEVPGGRYVDVIRLLREDGSVLVLHHVGYGDTLSEEQLIHDTTLVSGTYVTNDVNSKAYALVAIDIGILSQDQMAMLVGHFGGFTAIPAHNLPRRVEYFPGDGTSYIFHEWITPYGPEYYTSKWASSLPGAVQDLRTLESGWYEAGQTQFYLDSIRYNGKTLLTFDYAGHRRRDVAVDPPLRGRALFQGFDGHSFNWDLRGVEINALGKRTYVGWDSAMYGGEVDSVYKLTGFVPYAQEEITNNIEEYKSWSGMVAEIGNDERHLTFEYAPYKKKYNQTEFPRSSGEDPNDATLTLTGYRLTATENDAIRQEINWLNEDSSMVQRNIMGYAVNHAAVVEPLESQVATTITRKHSSTNAEISKMDYNIDHEGAAQAIFFTSVITNTDLVTDSVTQEILKYRRTNLGKILEETPEFSSTDVEWSEQVAGDYRTVTRTKYICPHIEVIGGDSIAANIFLPLEQVDSLVYRNSFGAIVDTQHVARRTWAYETTSASAIDFSDINNVFRLYFVAKLGHALTQSAMTSHVMTDTGWLAYTKVVQDFAHYERTTETQIRHDIWFDKILTGRAFDDWREEQESQGIVHTSDQIKALWANTNSESPWWVETEWIDTLSAISTPLYNVPFRTTLIDPLHANRILARTETRVDTNRSVVGQYDFEPNAKLGKVIASVSYSLDLIDSVITTIEYDTSLSVYGIVQLPSHTTSPLGATTNIWNHPAAWPSWASNGRIVAQRVQNEPPLHAEHSVPDTVSLLDVGTRWMEVPTLTETNVRKYLPTSLTSVDTATTRLRRATAATYFGLTSRSVDENGYVTDFEYDGIGRVKRVWMPGDYPVIDNYDWPYYDMLETTRKLEMTYPTSISARRIERIAFMNDCDTVSVAYPIGNPYVHDDTIHIRGIILALEELPARTGPCYNPPSPLMNRPTKAVETPQDYYHGQNISPWPAVFDWHSSDFTLTDNTFPIIPWEINQLDTAVMRFSIKSLVGLFSTVDIQVYWDDEIIVSTNRVLEAEDSLSFGGGDFDFEIDITSSLRSVLSNDTLTHALRIVMFTDTPSRVEFSRVWTDMEGKFRTWGRRLGQDFTLAMWYKDGATPEMATFAKIDDLHTTMDSSQHAVTNTKSRHSIRHTLFDHDYLPKEVRWNYQTGVERVTGSTTADYLSVSTVAYSGIGQALSSVNPLALGSTTSYDLLGRPVVHHPGATSLGFNNIASNSPPQDTPIEVPTHNYYMTGSPEDFDVPSDWQSDFFGLCRLSISQLNSALASRPEVLRTATFSDALGRTVLSVQGYHASKFADGCAFTDLADQNLITRYRYDNQNRTTHVWNPSGQLMRYWYDDWGRVKYVYQTDQGFASFAYDKLGQLRFSQTQEQRDRARVTYRQYDDLGRLLVIGEATLSATPPTIPDSGWANSYGNIETLPDSFNLNCLTDQLNPNVLLVDTAHILSANPTLWKVPQRPVPTAAHDSLLVVGDLCAGIEANSSSERFNPALPPHDSSFVVSHPAYPYVRPFVVGTLGAFENMGRYPEFPLQATWYDSMPAKQGAVFGTMPQDSEWVKRMPFEALRNLNGRPVVVAYRTHGGQPWHYIVRSYDERGRVEAMVRWTENLGFDGVYYTYNAMNAVVTVHAVDPIGQHASFYGYDPSGRVHKTWVEASHAGFGIGDSAHLPTLIRRPVSTHDIGTTYNVLDLPLITKYKDLDLGISRTYNDAGLLKTIRTTGLGMSKFMDLRFVYDTLGRIVTQYNRGSQDSDVYTYDKASRLTTWKHNRVEIGLDGISNSYTYDRIGNRLENELFERTNAVLVASGPTAYTSSFAQAHSWKNHLTEVARAGRSDVMTYNANGSMITRQSRDTNATLTLASHRIESYAYDAFGLIERYWANAVQGKVSIDTSCGIDASTGPLNDWRYRFSPMSEREQKRQYSHFGDTNGLAWIYYLLGADAKQLSVWNGVEGDLCGVDNTVWMWPVERNGFGPGNTRIIIRQDSTREYVVSDHIGSTRVVVNANKDKLEEHKYEPFGGKIKHEGMAARTSYIGRETDTESDLGAYGVRMYSSDYGRFVSIDPLWTLYPAHTPFHYCRNAPVLRLDPSGLADFYNNRGVLLGSDGVADGIKFLTSEAIIANNRGEDGIDYASVRNALGTFELPSEEVWNEILSKIERPGLSDRVDVSTREHAGVVGTDNKLYMAKPGEPMSLLSKKAHVDISEAIAACEATGAGPALSVHTHPNGDLTSSSQTGQLSPSAEDFEISARNIMPGLMIFPQLTGSEATFYRQLDGTQSSIRTNVRAITNIVRAK